MYNTSSDKLMYENNSNNNGYVVSSRKRVSGATIVILTCCALIVLLLGLFIALLARGGSLELENRQSIETAEPMVTSKPTAQAANAESEAPSAGYDLTTSASETTEMLSAGKYTRAQVVEMAAPSVVGIDVESQSMYYFGYTIPSSGSGVIITADGYIVTCAHVVEDASKIMVTLNNDESYEAKLIGSDSRLDLAVIKIEAEGLTPAILGDSDMLTVGEDVIAIGNPLGELRGTATAGIISAVARTVNVGGVEMQLVQTDAAISPGNSGGGLFNSSGKLIGIVNAKADDDNAEGLGFAIPVNGVVSEINDLLNYGYVTGRARLGVSTQNVTLRNDRGGWSYRTYCVQIAEVVEGSTAEKAGLLVGDLILAVDDYTISSNDDLSDAISAYDVGDSATLIIQRDGKQISVTVNF